MREERPIANTITLKSLETAGFLDRDVRNRFTGRKGRLKWSKDYKEWDTQLLFYPYNWLGVLSKKGRPLEFDMGSYTLRLTVDYLMDHPDTLPLMFEVVGEKKCRKRS